MSLGRRNAGEDSIGKTSVIGESWWRQPFQLPDQPVQILVRNLAVVGMNAEQIEG